MKLKLQTNEQLCDRPSVRIRRPTSVRRSHSHSPDGAAVAFVTDDDCRSPQRHDAKAVGYSHADGTVTQSWAVGTDVVSRRVLRPVVRCRVLGVGGVEEGVGSWFNPNLSYTMKMLFKIFSTTNVDE